MDTPDVSDTPFFDPFNEEDTNCNADKNQESFQPSNPDSPPSSSSTGNDQQSDDPCSANSGGSVARRNERERKRVRMVNMGFAKLRQYVPLATRGKRLSKVETLRSAIDYIRQLRQLLLFHQQQRMEDPVYYHMYDHHQHHPHPLQQQPQQQQHQTMYQSFEFGPQRTQNCYYDGLGPACYAADGGLECGGGVGGWSASSESPCSSIESEMSSPQCSAMLEPDPQMPCWTV